jgi:hypothetical protein
LATLTVAGIGLYFTTSKVCNTVVTVNDRTMAATEKNTAAAAEAATAASANKVALPIPKVDYHPQMFVMRVRDSDL